MTSPDLAITAGEITDIQNAMGSFLGGTAVIMRSAGASDGIGGFTSSFVAHGTVAARIGLLSRDEFGGQQLVVGEQLSEITSYVLNVPAGTDVTETDRIQFAGRTYEVASVIRRTPDELIRRVRIREAVD